MIAMRTAGKLVVLGVAVVAITRLWIHRGPASAPGAHGPDASAAPSSATASASPSQSPSAPALALPDLSGRPVSLASLQGRAVAVNFWASWCPPCRAEIPELSAYYRENHDRCFEMLGVAESSGGRDDVAAAATRLGIAYPVLLDPDGAAAGRFGVDGLPHTVIIDAQGKVRSVFEGAIGREELNAALGPLLPPRGTPCPRA
jgi:cytochrome c biogenesis protein CcmG/thiol:disulfide interchange protein DsbE